MIVKTVTKPQYENPDGFWLYDSARQAVFDVIRPDFDKVQDGDVIVLRLGKNGCEATYASRGESLATEVMDKVDAKKVTL